MKRISLEGVVAVKSKDGQLILFPRDLTHFPWSLQHDVGYSVAPYWIYPVGVGMIAVISQLVWIYRFSVCFAFPAIELRVAFFFPFLSFFFFFFCTCLWQRGKSHVWMTRSGRCDDHFTETTLGCHFVGWISTHVKSEDWWCLLESNWFPLHLCH